MRFISLTDVTLDMFELRNNAQSRVRRRKLPVNLKERKYDCCRRKITKKERTED